MSRKLQPNPNRALDADSCFHVRGKGGDCFSRKERLWNGRVSRRGRVIGGVPPASRVAKEALYRTGATRIFDRQSGTGRPLNEPPKKSGRGGHNWGRLGDEVGVGLADMDELREIERQFNPTAPSPDEEPRMKEIEEEEEEFYDEYESSWSGWEPVIAGNLAKQWPGYWEGVESVRSLFGEEPPSEDLFEQKELPHAVFEWEEMGDEKKEKEEERRIALKIGGPPEYLVKAKTFGDKESEKSFFEGDPVIPWGEERRASMPDTRGLTSTAASASQALQARGRLPDEGPIGLEAERMATGRKDEAPANFDNKDIKTEVRIEPGFASRVGEGPKSIIEMEKIKEHQMRLNMAESASLPSS